MEGATLQLVKKSQKVLVRDQFIAPVQQNTTFLITPRWSVCWDNTKSSLIDWPQRNGIRMKTQPQSPQSPISQTIRDGWWTMSQQHPSDRGHQWFLASRSTRESQSRMNRIRWSWRIRSRWFGIWRRLRKASGMIWRGFMETGSAEQAVDDSLFHILVKFWIVWDWTLESSATNIEFLSIG